MEKQKNKKKILVVGDVIFDKYVYVETNRIAQEANIPVYDQKGVEWRAGGAANVAVNIASLAENECDVWLAGIHCDLTDIIPYRELKSLHIYPESGEELIKTRYVCDNKIVCRIDNNIEFDSIDIGVFEDHFIYGYTELENLSTFDLIVISDYDKGTITPKLVELIKKSGIKTIVDSKRKDLRIFDGLFALNINEHEYAVQVSNNEYHNVGSFFDYVVVTKGKKGSVLIQTETLSFDKFVNHKEEFPTKTVDVVDVTGCGDTHTAGFAVGIMRDKEDVRNAVRFANACATQVVTKFGTARVNKWDL